MLQEAANELVGGNSHHLLLLAVLQLQQAAIGNGHAVRIAAQVLEHVLGPAKGGLGVNHPFFLFPWRQVAGKGLPVAQGFQIAEEVELAGGMSFCQALQEETPEQAAENLDREKEAAAADNPLVVIGG